MIPVNEATASLIKLIDGTMQAAKMNITSSKTPTDPAEPITYEGEYGKVRLEFDNNVINVKAIPKLSECNNTVWPLKKSRHKSSNKRETAGSPSQPKPNEARVIPS